MEKVTIVDGIDVYKEEIKGLCPDWTDDQCVKFMMSLKEPLSKIIHQTIGHCLAEWAIEFDRPIHLRAIYQKGD